MYAYTVLICDDSDAVHESLVRFFREENIQVISAYDGGSALDILHSTSVDLIILDIMLPDISGTELCSRIRRTSNVPILFLSARGEEIDRIIGLELGADDYVTKPFSAREVTIRVKRILTRARGTDVPEILSYMDLRIIPEKLEVTAGGEKMELTAREVQLLSCLVKNAQKVLNREQLLEHVWGFDYLGDTRAVDAAIKRIRKKLPEDKIHFEIQTVYGVGYRLKEKE